MIDKISNESKDALREIYSKYSEMHNKLNKLEEYSKLLEEERQKISSQLNLTRELEKDMINNIESELGVKLSTDVLNEIINQVNDEINA